MDFFVLDEHIINDGFDPEAISRAAAVRFVPTFSTLSACRGLYREALLSAVRAGVAVWAFVYVDSGSFLDGDECDSLCELLSFADGIITDRQNALSIISPSGDIMCEECDEQEILKRLYGKFGLTFALLSDASIGFDGESFSFIE